MTERDLIQTVQSELQDVEGILANLNVRFTREVYESYRDSLQERLERLEDEAVHH